MHLGLVFTNKCNAKCNHCGTNCGPERNDRLSLPVIKQLMYEAASLGDDSLSCFSITGGEPFLYWNDLLEMVRTGAQLGAKMTCVTNGSWAVSYEKALEKMSALQDAGLKLLAISTSEYHQQFIPLERVRNAARAAICIGLEVVIKYPYARHGVQPDELAELLGPEVMSEASMEIFSVMPSMRSGYHVPKEEMVAKPGIPVGRCPAAVVTIREDGQAYTCCIPGGFIEPLKLGHIGVDSLSCIHERFQGGDLQQLLFVEGPALIARKASESGLGYLLQDSYTSICHLCTDILAKPQLYELAMQIAEEYQLERLCRIATTEESITEQEHCDKTA